MAQENVAQFMQHDVNTPSLRTPQVVDDAMAGCVDPLPGDTFSKAVHCAFLEDQTFAVLFFDRSH